MEAIARLPAERRIPALLAGFDLQKVSIWLLGFGLTVYLGLKGGGYDPLVNDQVGIVVWWIAIAGLLVGAFPNRRLGVLGWTTLALFAAFVAWTALSLGWTESNDKTSADLARVAGYLGIFSLALFIRGSRAARLMVAAVGTGIACVSIVALLSRLHPSWFPEAQQTAKLLGGGQDRLAFPLNYWNAVAALAAIGLPLMLNVATSGKSAILRALGAAALPAMALTIFFTLSRGGIAAAVIALAVYLVFAGDRLPRLLTLLVAASGGAILIAAAAQRHDLQEGLLNATAHHQGNEMLTMTIVVCLGVALVQAGISLVLIHNMRPSWTVPTRGATISAVAAGAIVVLIAAAALNAPHRISDAWDQFKVGHVESGAARLSSFGGQNRYQFWKSAIEEEETKPLTGTGSGTFEYWWARNGETGSVVRDTHSLYFQTLGELGLVGIALLAGFMVALFVGGGRKVIRAAARGRPQLAAAYAGCTAFFVTAIFDWTWQIPVLPIAMLLLAAPLVTAGVRSRRRRGQKKPWALRVALVGIAFAGIVAIAIPLSSTSLLRESQAQAREGDIPAALESASSAHNAQPDAALPHLQQALLLEEQGHFAAGVTQARAATRNEPTNWRNWLILTRLEVESGHPQAAVHAYKRASSLDPHNSIFNRAGRS
jgi:O-antigen ligase